MQFQKLKKVTPSLISCKTVIGFGSPNKAGTASVRGSPLGEEEIKLVRKLFDWDHNPFDIPKHIFKAWQKWELEIHILEKNGPRI